MTEVIAHRGASYAAPENTFEAFELAISEGADRIETDLHLAADRSLLVLHDPEVDGVPIHKRSLRELRPTHPEIPTLDEVLAAFGRRVPFNLELKHGTHGEYPGIEERVLDLVRAHALLETTLFSSFRLAVLRRLRELESSARIGVLVSSRLVGRAVRFARDLGAEAVHPARRRVDAAVVQRIHDSGLRANVYTVDEPEDQRRLIEWGIDGIFTNRPGQLAEIVRP